MITNSSMPRPNMCSVDAESATRARRVHACRRIHHRWGIRGRVPSCANFSSCLRVSSRSCSTACRICSPPRICARCALLSCDHVVDLLDRLGDLPAAARLLLERALDVLGDGAHLLGALHDQLRAARLLAGGGGDLLHRLGDAPIASVTCFEPFACSTVARAIARTMFVDFGRLEDLLQRALGLVRDLDAAVDVVRAALDGGDRVLRLGLDGLDEVGDLLGRRRPSARRDP